MQHNQNDLLGQELRNIFRLRFTKHFFVVKNVMEALVAPFALDVIDVIAFNVLKSWQPNGERIRMSLG